MTLTRREFLKASGLAAAYLSLPALLNACAQPGAAASAQPLADPTSWAADRAAEDPALLHVLQRLTYGPAPGDLARLKAQGPSAVDAFIEQQLHPERIDDSALEQRLASLNTLGMSSADLYAAYPPRKKDVADTKPAPMMIVQQLEQASLLRAVYSQRQLQEVMVDFWSNHLNIYIGKDQIRWLKTVDDRDAMRPNALGKFRDLLLASAKSPAMLMFLDNFRNVMPRPQGQGGLNENYARELMELHTIGADAGYDHDDIVAVARAFTGWSIARDDERAWGSFVFRPRQHDNAPKQIKVLGLNLPAGGGINDGETLIAHLAADPRTAQRIAQKLCMRFVSDDPPADLVAQTAQTFLTSDGDIKATLGVILHSDAFKAAAGQKVKLPLHALASMLRALGADASDAQPLVGTLRQLGQPFFGWQAPNGYPQVGAAWVNTSGMLARWNTAFALSAGRVKSTSADIHQLLLAHGLPSAPTAADLVDATTDALLHVPVSDEARSTLIDYVSEGGGATKRLNANLVARKLSGVAGLVLASPVFQTY